MNPSRENFRPIDASGILSWVHFGDLHLTVEHARNHQDFLALIAEANAHLAGLDGVNFAVLPRDNADNGTEAQFRLVRRAIDGLHLPVHALPGHHDIQSGNLGWFRRWLEPVLPRSFVAGGRLDLPVRSAIDSENPIGAYPSKGLLGTRLGPNKNGHGWGSS